MKNTIVNKPVQYYVKTASAMEERTALILDPMLATGGTLIAADECTVMSKCHGRHGRHTFRMRPDDHGSRPMPEMC